MFLAGVTVTDLNTLRSESVGPVLSDQSGPERAVADLLVNALQLEVTADSIDPGQRLFGEGLGLDSIDALELALAITRTYGFELRSDDERNHQIFASLRSLTRHIEAHRTR
ncbi:MAG: acyl carrier protein [Gemmatimonadaceae bacterium]|nr:acyl carrier protein [Acetobacteraceae bacterium]